MKYTIYIHANKANGKVYVGLTSKTIKGRWSEHRKKAKYDCKSQNGNYFQRAIIKYDDDNWNSKMLEICNSLEKAEIAEIKWIAYYKSNQKKFGYNLTIGGNVSQSTLDPRICEKISKSISKIVNDPEYKQNQKNKMIQWHKNNNNPFLGKTHSKESKIKMSKAVCSWHENNDNPFKGKKHTDETRRRMSEAAKRRCAEPNWQSPLAKNGVSDETRHKMSESAKKRNWTSRYCIKEDLFKLAKQCKTQKEIADELGCTPANVSFLIRSWDIKSTIQRLLKEDC